MASAVAAAKLTELRRSLELRAGGRELQRPEREPVRLQRVSGASDELEVIACQAGPDLCEAVGCILEKRLDDLRDCLGVVADEVGERGERMRIEGEPTGRHVACFGNGDPSVVGAAARAYDSPGVGATVGKLVGRSVPTRGMPTTRRSGRTAQ